MSPESTRGAKDKTNYPPKEFYFSESRSREIWLACYGMLPEIITILADDENDIRTDLANCRLTIFKEFLNGIGLSPHLYPEPRNNQSLNFWKDWGPIPTSEYAACHLLLILETLPDLNIEQVKIMSPEFVVEKSDAVELLKHAILFELPKPLQEWIEAYVFTLMTAKILGIQQSEFQS
ncbi:MAG: hypothetical protein A3D24_04795 [Candidatus Blackburnbacteria bacterium RIFCSPHIGHO2_02_FULL_39_13]|uniref:Uncharacterized protein n=1 Tax=Candidatus Blackburnbacteria bacterium RIFCSPLOWO2_01_FULL_40_20 TaxID=1797519 RepID=A0A1G1VBC2_9BACT|nr:MAG: hypothetical protein UT38_C0007G0031 [Microgenomates group bacterium GW2011_GWA2_39_19]OGY07107.1 MAG: hypothetical protein A2694_03465 [Candidatus Blackburnbacteria bacterium RIFCSPHIGHO2_01_FULL_40_17]OGY08929.1 MAG: hypothetical protein A3D24_04795 [Candidatus Blackburnbacteria bacterium RIFCSPHIGHO2_02_FULL_39_13]OGY12725.1 MAG: hypothetical protein A3A77_00350 [Candidatus Blackburnbacteria bacterium RIFCSPLOWO2_01_FULL_40_20]OGY15294.1 MAG: hypothetical protein A3I52_01150 [Candida